VRGNSVKQRLLNGETVVGTFIQEMTSPSVAQILKLVGFDFVLLDTEHSPYSLETASHILRVAWLLDMCPMLRVKSPEYDLIAPALDNYAMGIVMPRIESRDEVQTFLSCMKYPPVGIRGLSSDAPHSEYDAGPLDQFVEHHNQNTLAVVQIERKLAVERVDDLLSVPGVDVALIGPEDLSLSLGIPGETENPVLIEAIETVIASAQRHNVAAGIALGGVDQLLFWHSKGVRMLTYGSDMGFLMEAGQAGLGRLRAALK
jgi:2-keto-3-deoxy-L-rhamnonate aldolase RhmA